VLKELNVKQPVTARKKWTASQPKAKGSWH